MKFKAKLQPAFTSLLVFLLGATLHCKDENNSEKSIFPRKEMLIPEKLLDASGSFLSSESLDKKYIGLYFSASWCGPCRKFTPKLVEFRNKFSDDFEVILIGGDGSSKAQANYMKKYSMPWYAMQNQSTEAKFASRFCEVKSIPYLVILDQDGNIITKNGKSDLMKMGDQALEVWKNK
ncbi:MAG: thioredoxin fold domain-containing protein [Opitutales bacterium]|nr:thioredoxin fold domain-containing protein [Opitutales bacterium]